MKFMDTDIVRWLNMSRFERNELRAHITALTIWFAYMDPLIRFSDLGFRFCSRLDYR